MGRLNFTGILQGIKGPEDSICITLRVPLASIKCSCLVCTMIPFFWDMTLSYRVNGPCFPAKCQLVIALWHGIISQNIIPKTHNFLHHFTNPLAGTRTQKVISQLNNGYNPEPLPFTSFLHKFPRRPISLSSSLVKQPTVSTLLTWKCRSRHNPEPVPSTSYPHTHASL